MIKEYKEVDGLREGYIKNNSLLKAVILLLRPKLHS
jgi:hypothetical protein